jgi:hypothetical protein
MDILATATHPVSHLNGTPMSWLAPPAVPLGTFPCAALGALKPSLFFSSSTFGLIDLFDSATSS